MATVHNVTGAIDSADLGFTLVHEHIPIASGSLLPFEQRASTVARLCHEGLCQRRVLSHEARWAANPRRVFERQGAY